MRDPKSGKTYKLELVRILSAERQNVAGKNYKLKLRVKLNGEVKEAEAVVWWQSWRKPEPYYLSVWRWSDQEDK
jgi:hypothetical protein